MDSLISNYYFLSWNIRGLNNPARQFEVKQVIQQHKPHLVCLQETKLQQVDNIVIRNTLGHDYENNFLYLLAEGTRGGIILAYRDDHLCLQNVHTTTNTISARVTDNSSNTQWTITGVYGPQGDLDKKMFIRELRALKNIATPAWLIIGDFNLIYRDEDKSNDRLNRRMMLRFRRALNHLEVKEISLIGQKFTWSNGQNNPTMARIDRMFSTPGFESIYKDPVIQVQSSSISDHCPLLLHSLAAEHKSTRFQFESFWTEMPGFQACVEQQWHLPIAQPHNPLLNLHIKLSRTARGLCQWSKTLLPQGKLAMAICREVIAQLDKAQEDRQLASAELQLKKTLKSRLLGLAAIEKARARQKSRLTWLRKGDVNTKYFQIMANVRKRKNYIHALQTNERVVTSQQEKQQVIFDHFSSHIGKYHPRTCTLNLSNIGWEPKDLSHLDDPFTEDEIKRAIFAAPKEKAPGPDGFIGKFFISCWEIITFDLLAALNHFYNLNQQQLHLLNQALVVLIPKKGNPCKISDYRPISLVHSFAKIISKILANWLAPELSSLISLNQSAFIKKCSIHDNFVYVQEVVRELHKKKIPALFVKLDISKAFDTVSWPYLLEIMSFLGFGSRWCNWISALWCTTSSCFLLNGEPGKRILHARGVRQGDPLSPMLFLLAMEPLHLLFKYAQHKNLIHYLADSCEGFCFSLYADDAAVFIKPEPQDFTVLKLIMDIFGQASGLHTNMEKTEIYPIRCQGINLEQVLGEQHRIHQFPCKYLGLPLHTRKLPRASVQPIIQKIANRLPGWERDFFTYPGRELLVKTVLSDMPTYFLTIFKLPKWAIDSIDRFRRSFLWRGQDPDKVKGGHCLVNWETCTRPR